ncbi:hypothetical protein GQ85_19805 [Rhodococcus rhodochrous]|nr:hypothetical protein GQ85_19805 [Rhodococcus rhodochrous]
MIPAATIADVLRQHVRRTTDSVPQPNGPRLVRHHCACGSVTFDHDLHRANMIADAMLAGALSRLADVAEATEDCPGCPECRDGTDPDRARDLALADRWETL